MKFFITGGTGSFGSHYVKRLLDRGEEVTVYSRDEAKQYEMVKQYPSVRFVVGDIRDEDRLKTAVSGHDYVIHAAALKHVRTGELHPTEAVSTNVIGSWNVAKAVLASDTMRAVILSTDKAVMPINTYGATKYIAEKMWLRMNDHRQCFVATRYGNVMGSRGSVLHAFDKQQHNGVFSITDHRMTRFAVSFDYAMDLVDIAVMCYPGSTIVSKVKPFRIMDLAAAFNQDAGFEEMGIQAGEKLDEMMLTPYERSRALDCDSYYRLPPDEDGRKLDLHEAYTSGDGPFMNIQELREVINAAL